jgi:hypothetical protein
MYCYYFIFRQEKYKQFNKIESTYLPENLITKIFLVNSPY